jgi:YidC/Oxa1 family membrane protein insertase
MNMREILGTFSLALGTIILFKLFWGGWNGPQENGSFVAPTSQIEQSPLRLEVDFIDGEKETKENPVHVKTSYADMTFSSAGGTISDLTFIRDLDHKVQTFQVWNSKDAIDREQQPFLVALDQKTPYYYHLVNNSEDEQTAQITYEASTDQGTIQKKFTVYKDIYKIDVALTVKPNKTMRARLVWPSPLLKALDEEDPITATIISKNNKFEQINDSKINFRQGFFAPTLFGSTDKYFIFSMVKDSQSFTERAYYKSIDRCLLSFLEGKEVSEETTWDLSFYLGPKEMSAMDPVDTRLEKILNYGMFSFVAKPLLRFLKFLEGYTQNYGWAIVLVTLLLKLLLLPFTVKGERGMKKFQENQKKLEYITQKYKHDPEALEQAKLEHIKKYGTGGFIGGCLPMMVQTPFFLALFSGLNNSIELYRAPFILWIKDLSLPDPYYVLPFLVFLSIIFNALFAPGKKDVKTLMVPFIMALVFGAFSTTMAAGVSLYLFTNMFLQGLQSQIQKAF